jgi:hypothetical protein
MSLTLSFGNLLCKLLTSRYNKLVRRRWGEGTKTRYLVVYSGAPYFHNNYCSFFPLHTKTIINSCALRWKCQITVRFTGHSSKCVSSVRNLLHDTLLASRIGRGPLDFWKHLWTHMVSHKCFYQVHRRVFLEKLKTAKLLTKSPALHETQIFITAFTKACWWSYSRIRLIQSTAILF